MNCTFRIIICFFVFSLFFVSCAELTQAPITTPVIGNDLIVTPTNPSTVSILLNIDGITETVPLSKTEDKWTTSYNLPSSYTTISYKVIEDGDTSKKFHKADFIIQNSSNSKVSFFYDSKDHWLSDSITQLVVTVVGTFQSELGSPSDWRPESLITLMKDSNNDGIYEIKYTIPSGNHLYKITINQAFIESYPSDNISLQLSSEKVVLFQFNSTTKAVTNIIE